MPGLTSLCITILLNLVLFRAPDGEQAEFLPDIRPGLRLFIPVVLILLLLSILYGDTVEKVNNNHSHRNPKLPEEEIEKEPDFIKR